MLVTYFILIIPAVLNRMQDDNKNGDGDSQKNTSRNDRASLDYVKERPEQPEPEQLAKSKEETWNGERKDRLTSQAGNGKYCFPF